jgi:hypothetical protein
MRKLNKITYEIWSELKNGGPSMVYNRNEAENEEYGGRNAAITAEHVNKYYVIPYVIPLISLSHVNSFS